MNTYRGVSGRVDRLLEVRNVTLKDFATAIGLPYRTVQNYLTGNVKIPADFLQKSCDFFSVEADYILFGGIDLSRLAMVAAVQAVLVDILPNLELNSGSVSVSDDISKHDKEPEITQSYRKTIALMISSAIRDKYIQIRTDEISHGVDAGVSPADEAATQRRMRLMESLDR